MPRTTIARVRTHRVMHDPAASRLFLSPSRSPTHSGIPILYPAVARTTAAGRTQHESAHGTRVQVLTRRLQRQWQDPRAARFGRGAFASSRRRRAHSHTPTSMRTGRTRRRNRAPRALRGRSTLCRTCRRGPRARALSRPPRLCRLLPHGLILLVLVHMLIQRCAPRTRRAARGKWARKR